MDPTAEHSVVLEIAKSNSSVVQIKHVLAYLSSYVLDSVLDRYQQVVRMAVV